MEPETEAGIDRRAMTALSGGHLAVDFASGSVPALIPFMTDRFHLSYALAAMLLLAATASSSLVQPLFGLWSDRRGALWLIPGGALLAALGVGGAAISPAYPLVLLLVLAGGLGVAAFHPEGAKFAAYASGRQAGERHVVLQQRRQRRATRSARSRPASSSSGSGSSAASSRWSPVLLASLALARFVPYLAALTPQAARGRLSARRRPAARDGAARRRDRAAQRRVVHAARVRPALGRLARALEGGRQPAALPDAARGRGRDAAPRRGRRPDRAAHDARRSRRR